MAEVHHIEHTLVALVKRNNEGADISMSIGMVGCMGMTYISTRAGIEALRAACEAALRASSGGAARASLQTG